MGRRRLVEAEAELKALMVRALGGDGAAYATLLRKLQGQQGFACLLISHDMNIVRQRTGRVAVMQVGRIVEQGTTETVFAAPETAFMPPPNGA